MRHVLLVLVAVSGLALVACGKQECAPDDADCDGIVQVWEARPCPDCEPQCYMGGTDDVVGCYRNGERFNGGIRCSLSDNPDDHEGRLSVCVDGMPACPMREEGRRAGDLDVPQCLDLLDMVD